MFSLQLQISDKYRHLLVPIIAALLAISLAFILGGKYRQTFLLFNIDSFQQSSLQVFFDTGERIVERYSQVREIPGAAAYSLRFPVPDKPIYSLRIDPSASMRISDILLVDNRNALISRLDTGDIVALHDIDGIRKTDKGIQVITKGKDPQLRLVPSPRLQNTYGFNVLFALTLFFVLYSFLWLAFLVFMRFFVHSSPGPERSSRKLSRSWPAFFHLSAIIIGGIATLGALALWVCEGKGSLGKDHGAGDLSAYRSTVSIQPVTLKRQPDSLSLAAWLYRAEGNSNEQSAVLLLHGNYPQGSSFPLYQVMAAELARRGYAVLAMDFAGYGGSADPFSAGIAENIDLNIDALAGVHFLRQEPGIDGRRIHVAGHSMGADPAITVGSTTEAIRSITLIGPPRRVHERFNYAPDVNFFWNWALHVRKTVYGKEQFPDWYNKEIWRRQILERDMVNSLKYFSGWSHKPVLFLDGEREPGPDRRFLQWYYCKTSWPKQHITLNHANHDCNVTARNGRIYYDPAVMDQAVDAMDRWFRRAEGKQPQLSDMILNLLRRLFAVEMLKGC